ncbi:MAG: hypothetical protein P4L36_13930 [Holophaga sp.]|nr:hypothetical protein [Holophaga sp.]
MTKQRRRRIRNCILARFPQYFKVSERESELGPNVLIQDANFPLEASRAEKIMIFLVPEHNAMSGGIYSIISIANQMHKLKRLHGHEVLTMTRPTKERLTYFRNTHFRNAENIFRFKQILRCKSAKEIYIHCPEYTAVDSFLDCLSFDELNYLVHREKIHINILNQNIKLMPDPESFKGLRKLATSMSQSVAHHAYYNLTTANKYSLPTILLPAYTDLSGYIPSRFHEKEKLIIYSPDPAPFKSKCLGKIAAAFPTFELVEIHDISFDTYMEFATSCMFSITFGEGFDGYLAQPIYQGGIGFAVYNDDFFPSPNFKNFYNIFENEDQLLECICERMAILSQDADAYEALNKQLKAEYDKLYSYNEYIDQIKKLSLKEFDLLPSSQI